MPPSTKLPKRAIIAICIVSVLPAILLFFRVDFASPDPAAEIPEWLQYHENRDREQKFFELSGPFLYSLLEWTAFLVAIMTALLSFVHYRVRYDVTTPIIGTAMFFSGMLDAFLALTVNRLLFHAENAEQFFPFIWMVARSFNITILICGILPFLFAPVIPKRVAKPRDLGSLLLIGFLFGLMAYAIIHIYAGRIIDVPQSVYPDSIIKRPFDAIPLVLMVFAGGIVFPRFYQLNPSLFSHSLKWSMVPAVMAQAHVAVGSSQLYDSNFNIACFLKIIAYAVPLIGIILDYIRAYNSETVLQATESKLNAAREIQLSLLPKEAPEVAGFDIAGFSLPAEAVGGDYFDYMPGKDGSCGAVVADVSGHDLGASLLMSQTRAYLRALVDHELPLPEVLTRVNRYLESDTKARRFVCLVYVQLCPGQNKVEYSTAGHQIEIIRANGKDETLEAIDLPLCINTDQLSTKMTPELEPGDFLLVATDGLTEACGKDGEQFGLRRACDFIRRARDLEAQEIVDRLYRRVREFCDGLPQTDDVTVLLVKYNGTEGAVSQPETSEDEEADESKKKKSRNRYSKKFRN